MQNLIISPEALIFWRIVLAQPDYLNILNEEQLAAVKHQGSPLLILAGAGSGKTRVITTKIAYLIAEHNIEPERILAVTFTNKAAKEMSERASYLDKRAERAMIRTFHSFGAWILRIYAEWAGLSHNFTIYDDDDALSLLTQASPALTKNAARGIIKKFRAQRIIAFSPMIRFCRKLILIPNLQKSIPNIKRD